MATEQTKLMDLDELGERYRRSVKILRAEKAMRKEVFKKDPKKQAAKVAEIDQLLADLEAMKDRLKPLLMPIQPALIDISAEEVRQLWI
jgi:protein subunit release factor A